MKTFSVVTATLVNNLQSVTVDDIDCAVNNLVGRRDECKRLAAAIQDEITALLEMKQAMFVLNKTAGQKE